MIDTLIQKLTEYGIKSGLIEESDRHWAINQFLYALKLNSFEPTPNINDTDNNDTYNLEDILKGILNYASQNGLLESDTVTYRDLFDTMLMGIMTPLPHEVIREFYALYDQNPTAATDYFYKLAKDSDYIRTYRIAKDIRWRTATEYGDLDITINMAKPEKDPAAIAAARSAKQNGYPKCLLCAQNIGYAGRVDHPARQNLRLIPLDLCKSKYYMQYSPYVYYNEHCIVLNEHHIPMRIDADTIARLLDFTRIFPHYFIGSNADLPIVGGSILTHDHFQGGKYIFAMEKAPIETPFIFKGYEDVTAGIIKWPVSVIRISSENSDKVHKLACRILDCWRGYTDSTIDIYAETDDVPHNTITPIVRRRGEAYEIDLALRNNLTTDKHPMGLFHPHEHLHHIKKENIGLIEVMGLAVLPSRLKHEMQCLKEAILNGTELHQNPETLPHAEWAQAFIKKHGNINESNIDGIVKEEIGLVFLDVLKDAGVFKRDKAGQNAFIRFLEYVDN